MSHHDDFQPPEFEEDRDAKWDTWFDQQEKNGMAVLTPDEWQARLSEAYADGCSNQFEQNKELLAWAYSKLAYRSFSDMDDCLKMDEIKLMLMGAPL